MAIGGDFIKIKIYNANSRRALYGESIAHISENENTIINSNNNNYICLNMP